MCCSARLDRELDFRVSEAVSECRQHLVGKWAVDAQLDELAGEEPLVVEGVGNQLGRGDEAGGLVDMDLVLAIDDSASKRDG